MSRTSLIAQLIVLKQRYAPTGESNERLAAHFQTSMDNREIVMIQEKDQVVAFADWSWIDNPEDVQLVNKGEYTTGRILHLINLVCTRPGLILKIKQALPKHEWISGERNGVFHAPKGLPQLVEA
jgi:hypothetical protein